MKEALTGDIRRMDFLEKLKDCLFWKNGNGGTTIAPDKERIHLVRSGNTLREAIDKVMRSGEDKGRP